MFKEASLLYVAPVRNDFIALSGKKTKSFPSVRSFCVVLQINIRRNDGFSYNIHGEGMNEEPKGLLSFDQTTAAFYINEAVDYEKKNVYKVGGSCWQLSLKGH